MLRPACDVSPHGVSTLRYLIALLCPPVAILMCGHVFLFLISIPLCFFYFPAALLALLVVAAFYERHHDDRYVERSLNIQSDYLKIMKAHYRSLNASIEEDTRMAKLERKLRKQKAKAAAVSWQGPKPARKPLITWQGARSAAAIAWRGARSGAVMVGEMAVLTKRSAILAYRDLPEWAQPITWGLAAATPLSVVFVLVMTLKR
jgi:hypothetical protein